MVAQNGRNLRLLILYVKINAGYTVLNQSQCNFVSDMMKDKFKYAFSLVLVFTLLAPSVVRLGHHHDHFVCKARHEKHFHDQIVKCEVCAFQFSWFSHPKLFYVIFSDFLFGKKTPGCIEQLSPKNSIYAYFLRAPPFICN